MSLCLCGSLTFNHALRAGSHALRAGRTPRICEIA
ncbi:hypothetical protein MTBUT4_300052 [Magnetospirillum sp. UT-4]|nr:hypothetical protein MTBUT4_300052 [Magnetospirillum sp. UT-4]